MTTIVYDEQLNPIEVDASNDIDDIDTEVGMAAALRGAPITELKTETVPEAYEERMAGTLSIKTVGGGDIVSSQSNPMMVNTILERDETGVLGSSDIYGENPPPVESDHVVGANVDNGDFLAIESAVKVFDAILLNMGYNGKISTEGELVTPNPETPVDLSILMEEVEYVDDELLRSQSRTDNLVELRDEIIHLGGITRDQAYAVESLVPGVLSARMNLATFSKVPTKTNYDTTLVALEDLVEAAAVAGVVILAVAITKIIKWIFKAIERLRYAAKTDSVILKYNAQYEKLVKAIASSERRFGNTIAQSAPYCDFIQRELYQVGVDAKGEQLWHPIKANELYMQGLWLKLSKPVYSQIHEGLYTGQTMQICTAAATLFNTGYQAVLAHFDIVKSNIATDKIINPDSIVNHWKEMSPVAQMLGVGMGKTPLSTMATINQHVMQNGQPTGKEPPKFPDCRKFNFQMDKAFVFDNNAERKLGNMGAEISRLQQKLKNIPDPNVRANRELVLKLMLEEIKTAAQCLALMMTIQNSVIVYVSYLNQTISRTTRVWTEAFSKANVHFAL